MNPAPPSTDPASDSGSPRKSSGSIRIGTLAGAEVRVTPSWFLVAGLVALLIEPRIEEAQPGLGAWKFVAGLVFAVLLYLAILVHEASHAFMARRFGAQVQSITLHFLGGMTAVKGESRTPRQEFWVAVVGPLTSLALGLMALGAWFLTPPGVLRVGVEVLAAANLLIGLLNLLPAMPLDGGRVLQAALWRSTGNRHRASISAGRAGQVLAGVVLASPVVLAALTPITPGLVDFLLAGVLGAFLWGAATQTIGQASLLERLPRLVARELSRRVALVDARTPLALAVRTAQEQQAGSIVTLDQSGQPTGVVAEAALLAIPEERRPWVPVSSVAKSLEPELTLSVDLRGEELLRAVGRHPASEYLLVDTAGVIHGVLATVDLDRAFRAQHI